MSLHYQNALQKGNRSSGPLPQASLKFVRTAGQAILAKAMLSGLHCPHCKTWPGYLVLFSRIPWEGSLMTLEMQLLRLCLLVALSREGGRERGCAGPEVCSLKGEQLTWMPRWTWICVPIRRLP